MEILFAAFVNALAQVLRKYSNNEYVTIFMVLGLSVAAAGFYVAMVQADFWTEAVRIFTIAGAIYSYIILRFQGGSDSALPNV